MFKDTIWQHSSQGGWYFVTLPIEISKEIRENLKWQEEGWGRMRIVARIGNTDWKTAIWFDSKLNTYLLPIKGNVRTIEKLQVGDEVEVFISV